MSNPESDSLKKLQTLFHKHTKWTVHSSVACPDYKRPSVDRKKKVCSNEHDAYAWCVEELGGYGIESECYFEDENNQKKHPELYNIIKAFESKSKDVSLEDMQKLVKAANDGEFNEYRFRDCYMNEPAFSFQIQETTPLVVISNNNGQVKLVNNLIDGENLVKELLSQEGDTIQNMDLASNLMYGEEGKKAKKSTNNNNKTKQKRKRME
jgi:hypothetical protein